MLFHNIFKLFHISPFASIDRFDLVILFLTCKHVKILQIKENPRVYIPYDGTTGFKLWPVFSFEKILVRREMEAFPLDSLVADCGGILGLFLGFNFLMIWEWIMDFLMFCFTRVIRI